MLTAEQLEAMRDADTSSLDRDDLADISLVHLDPDLPVHTRYQSYLHQIKNPYHFRCGKVYVHLQFEAYGGELSSKIRGYFLSLKSL